MQIKSISRIQFLALIISILTWSCISPTHKKPEGATVFVRVLLDKISTKDSLYFKKSYYLYSEEARYEFGERNNKVYIVPLIAGLQLYNRNRNLLYKNDFPIILKPVEQRSHFIFKKNEYDGDVIFTLAEDSAIYIINRLPLEEYLKGVVPAEINTTKQDLFEAIKAQAICARTYALKKISMNKNKPYDVSANISDQVYAGFNQHTILADRAIAETKNIILHYQGKPATIYYHSTCGGKLAAVQEVWNQPDIPYLQGGIDAVKDVYLCSNSPHFRWIEKRRITQLDSLFFYHFHKGLLKTARKDTFRLQFRLQIMKRDHSNRISELEIQYADTSVTLSGNSIRKFFGWPPGNYLPSNLFYIEQDSDSTMMLVGAGNGHGVGMCQWGAMDMAKQGFKYYHILSKYFPGTKLARIE
jgi:stage II sporulation protein D